MRYNSKPVSENTVAQWLDSGLEVYEFELISHYYVRFRTNTLGKSIELTYSPPPAMGWRVSLLFFSKNDLGIKKIHEETKPDNIMARIAFQRNF